MDKIIKISEPIFSSEEIKNLKNVLKSGWLTQGKYVEAFENHFSKLHNIKYSLATTSCTTALHLILSALEIKKGDEVIVPSFTWVSTINSILYCERALHILLKSFLSLCFKIKLRSKLQLSVDK